jgi:hypothetical protein
VAATCEPDDNRGPMRGSGGWCEQCTLRCLPPDARIATPGGDRAVRTLREGDLVWTMDGAGARVAAPVVLVRARAVDGQAHRVLRVVLDDGRVLVASSGHPDAGGRALSALAPGDVLDGARVTAVETVPFAGDATWDLRPAGETGVYWADGVLLGSTLGGP